MIIISDATFGYGRRVVLDQVNVNIAAGDFWFFIGPNGEGKSTFVKTILGIHPPLAGRVEIDVALGGNCGIGFVPQRCDLNPTLPITVREFVGLGRVGLPRSEDESANLFWALTQVGLETFATKNYWTLSGGQRQRALVARALIRRPHLLIADEPTNGLDLSTEKMLLDNLQQLHKNEKTAVIFVTHVLALAERYATHVALFHHGKVISGTREEILDPRRLAKTYNLPESYFQ